MNQADLREDAIQIWKMGLDAVRSDRLVEQHVRVEEGQLRVGDQRWGLEQIDRICVVGAGKAGAGMAEGLERALGAPTMADKQVSGWVNVPDNCVRALTRIHLHPARPAGCNEPTQAGQRGTDEILRRVSSLGPRDLCLCLISGGASALMPAPIAGISLEDKLQLTRHLSSSGANIHQLNSVRKQVSSIKGGGLARACSAGHLVTLIISDVMGDPLPIIASGPSVIEADPADATAKALEVLEAFDARAAGIPERIFQAIRQAGPENKPPTARITNRIIGNNRTAVEAAAREARRRRYTIHLLDSETSTTTAEQVGQELAKRVCQLPPQPGRTCFVSGGEPVVKLVDAAVRGLGGRNQQLVLAALIEILDRKAIGNPLSGHVLLSGGTDGEDGPTDAAGGLVDASIVEAMRQQQLDPTSYLVRNDAYHFLQLTGGLLMTGPTHTNVCDVRVAVVD